MDWPGMFHSSWQVAFPLPSVPLCKDTLSSRTKLVPKVLCVHGFTGSRAPIAEGGSRLHAVPENPRAVIAGYVSGDALEWLLLAVGLTADLMLRDGVDGPVAAAPLLPHPATTKASI